MAAMPAMPRHPQAAYRINNARVSLNDVGVSYQAAVRERQLWRVFTAAVSHTEIPHLLFNLVCLWQARRVEIEKGSLFFLGASMAMLLGVRTYIRTNKLTN